MCSKRKNQIQATTLTLTLGLVFAACSDGKPDTRTEADGAGGKSPEIPPEEAVAAPADRAPDSKTKPDDETKPGDKTKNEGAPLLDDGKLGPEPGLKVAYVGDLGLWGTTRENLRQVVSEGADALVILGDFDYQGNAMAFDNMLTQELGELPVFGVVGNHDLDDWPGYQSKLEARLASNPDAACTGSVGEDYECSFRGLHFVFSSVAVLEGDHLGHVAGTLAESNHTWKHCLWHHNQSDTQLGAKGNDVGWELYQACQAEGAIVLNGHEHSYARTQALTDIGNVAAGHGALGVSAPMELSPGSFFIVTSGTGGNDIREYIAERHDDDTWWAQGFTSNVRIIDGERVPGAYGNTGAGVFFIEYGAEGDPRSARAYYRTTKGDVLDDFVVTQAAP